MFDMLIPAISKIGRPKLPKLCVPLTSWTRGSVVVLMRLPPWMALTRLNGTVSAAVASTDRHSGAAHKLKV